jgi:uncharacterized protein (DUF2267 family)
MSAHGLEVFDRTFETTHIWLNELCEELGPDKHVAWRVLSVVLQQLRDRLPLPLAAHLGAQLPLLVRGVYYDQFEPGRNQGERKSRDEFISEIHESLAATRPVNAEHAIRCVLGLLARHISEGQVRKVRDAMPSGMRQLWEPAEHREHAEARHEESRPAEPESREEPLILTEEQQLQNA